MRGLIVSIAIAAALVAPRAAHADGTRYAVIIQGASGDPQYATLHRSWVDALAALLRGKMGLDPSHITILAEQPKPATTAPAAKGGA